MERLLREGIIEPSRSLWRAQVVLTKDENHKKRLAIDYSQTINRFTLLDAFPLPRITDMFNKIAQYRVLSTTDHRSAYHQVPLKDEDKPCTAFKARTTSSSSLVCPLASPMVQLVSRERWWSLYRRMISRQPFLTLTISLWNITLSLWKGPKGTSRKHGTLPWSC